MKMSLTELDFRALALPKQFDPDWDRKIVVNTPLSPDHRNGFCRLDFNTYEHDNLRLCECIFWIAHSFEQWATGKEATTITERFNALKPFFEYVAKHQKNVFAMTDISPTVLDEFGLWIREHVEWSWMVQRRAWSVPNQLLTLLQKGRPEIVRSDLRVFRFSGPTGANHPNLKLTKDVLKREEMGAIIQACRNEITKIRKIRAEASVDMLKAINRGYTGSRLPNFDSRGETLVWLRAKYLKRDHGKTSVSSRIIYHLIEIGRFGYSTMDDVYRCFLLGLHEIIPYLVLIAVYTGANTGPLLNFEIDCLTDIETDELTQKAKALVDILSRKRDHIYWDKKRSGYIQHRSFEKGDVFLPPALIRDIISFSHPIRHLVDKRFGTKLFVNDSDRKKVVWLRQDALSQALIKFRKRHKLAYFTIRSLRAALINYGHIVARGNIINVQRLANHRSANTTQNDYLSGVGRRYNDRILGGLQIEFVKWLSGKEVAATKQKDQTDSHSIGEEIARNWLALFSNPANIILGNTERIARILQLRTHLVSARSHMHPTRWQAVCAPLYEMLENDVLPKIATARIKRAEPIVALLSPLPPIE